ncbi:hypothetical protein A2U01_0107412, partial [Trifolium medium]|nr:hypothetical protein [Trifolium medium]
MMFFRINKGMGLDLGLVRPNFEAEPGLVLRMSP